MSRACTSIVMSAVMMFLCSLGRIPRTNEANAFNLYEMGKNICYSLCMSGYLVPAFAPETSYPPPPSSVLKASLIHFPNHLTLPFVWMCFC